MLSVVVDGEKSTNIPSRGLYKASVECSGGTTGEWDYNAWNLIINNAETNSKCNINFTSNLTQEEYDKYIEAGKALRRNTYRGKDITSYLSASGEMNLYTQISSGRFNDIYVGDYIVANNITWLVADIDNYLYIGSGASPLIKHHATIIPASSLTTAPMNATDTTASGYANSQMKQSTLPNVLSTYVEPAFSGHILEYSTFLISSVDETAGKPNNWGWYESQIDLMSEVNVYGSDKLSSSGYDAGTDYSQYAIFHLKPEMILTNGSGERISYWLKSIVNSKAFAYVANSGMSFSAGASESNLGVRPRFLIG